MRSACVCLALALAGCYRLPLDRSAPLGKSVLDARPKNVPVHGFQVELEVARGEKSETVEGELLAVEPERLFVRKGGQTVSIDRANLREMEILELFPSGAEAMGIWTALGAASTASHGLGFVISLPIWLVAGIPTAIDAAYSNDIKVPLERYDLLHQFARYPQGMPAPPAPPAQPEPNTPPVQPASPGPSESPAPAGAKTAVVTTHGALK